MIGSIMSSGSLETPKRPQMTLPFEVALLSRIVILLALSPDAV